MNEPLSLVSGSLPARRPDTIRVGTWNVSWWTQTRLVSIQSLDVQLIALQETKLSSLYVEQARSSLKHKAFVLHHMGVR